MPATTLRLSAAATLLLLLAAAHPAAAHAQMVIDVANYEADVRQRVMTGNRPLLIAFEAVREYDTATRRRLTVRDRDASCSSWDARYECSDGDWICAGAGSCGDDRSAWQRHLRDGLNRAAELAAAEPRTPSHTWNWIEGQRVRVALALADSTEAWRVATDCRAIPWVCFSLRGLIAARRGLLDHAQQTFDSALATMPVPLRCHWDAPGHRLGRADRATGDNCLPGNGRPLWDLLDPLYSTSANELRLEQHVRLTELMVHSQYLEAIESSCGHDHHMGILRSGWDGGWHVKEVRRNDSPVRRYEMARDPPHGEALVPAHEAIDAPYGSGLDDWLPRREGNLSTALGAPLIPAGFQGGLLRRADGHLLLLRGHASTLGHCRFTGHTRSAAGIAPLMMETDGYTFQGSGSVADTALLVSVEGQRPEIGWCRGRAGIELSQEGNDFPLSSILLLDPATPDSLGDDDAVLGAMLPSDTVRGTSVSLYWETYETAGPVAEVQVEMRPVGGGGLLRAVRNLFGGGRQEVGLRWTDRLEVTGPSRQLTRVQLSDGMEGEYLVVLTVRSGEGTARRERRIWIHPR